jgi:hypothetical protein
MAQEVKILMQKKSVKKMAKMRLKQIYNMAQKLKNTLHSTRSVNLFKPLNEQTNSSHLSMSNPASVEWKCTGWTCASDCYKILRLTCMAYVISGGGVEIQPVQGPVAAQDIVDPSTDELGANGIVLIIAIQQRTVRARAARTS